MIWTLFSWLYSLICLAIDMSFFVRSLPPLFFEVGAVAAMGILVTSLPRSKYSCSEVLGRCIAHRGAALDAPENTMAAFKYCVERGCQNVELDIQLTRDGQIIVAHDPQIGGLSIVNNDWETLKTVQLGQGHPMGDKFGIVNPCLYDEALDYLLANDVKVIVDLKDMDSRLCAAIAKSFKTRPNMYQTVIVTGINPVAVYKIRRHDPDIVGALSYRPYIFSCSSYNANSYRKRFPDSVLKHLCARILDELHHLVWWMGLPARWVGASALLIHKDIISPSVVEGWRRSGYAVAAWTVNQPQEKQHVSRVLGLPYLADTLVGEPTPTTPHFNGHISLH